MSRPPDLLQPLEMWGGLECTVNRVGDRFLDQLELNGHLDRIDDLDRFAELGISAIRYPVLWERTAPGDPAAANWAWSDLRLSRLRELEVRPIVGLLHHGSGPRGTSLLDPDFPALLARYAGAVAERYPWVMDYTPVNEPLTTARFSALYGHWYPHRRDEGAFFRAVLTQCQGIAAAMRAIRSVNPKARLIQTEDLGEVFARPALIAQAEYENERRWLSLDLLAGRLVPGHRLWEPLLASGITEAELKGLSEEPCVPDMIGINHYLTSERLLDERIERYPVSAHGGNGRQTYADVEAVRVCIDGPGGWRRLLESAWRRYGRPVAATEVHLACSRDEQLRWLAEAWTTAQNLRAEGIEVQAVTAWSLLGAFGWNTLVTEEGGDYEPGVFDLRAPTPRPTAIARLVADLAAGKEMTHPLLAIPGWWRRPSRLLYPPVDQWGNDVIAPTEQEPSDGVRGILLAGPDSPLTDAFTTGSAIRAIPWRRLDVSASPDWAAEIIATIASSPPWAVILTMGPTGFRSKDLSAVARTCTQAGIPVLFCSVPDSTEPTGMDFVADPHGPTGSSGQVPHGLEQVTLSVQPRAVVARGGREPMPELDPLQAELLRPHDRRPGTASIDVRDLVEISLDLLIDGESGRWQVIDNVGVRSTWLTALSPLFDQTARTAS